MMPETLKKALRSGFEKLTKEELINLAILLMDDGLHNAGRKPKKEKKAE